MSDGKVHIAVGLFIGVLLYAFVDHNLMLIPIAMVYSILPDIDIRSSHSFKWYSIAAIVFSMYFIFFPETILWNIMHFEFQARYIGILGLSSVIVVQFFQHREFFHSIAAGMMLSLPWYAFFGKPVVAAALLGYYSHLLLDDELFDGVWT